MSCFPNLAKKAVFDELLDEGHCEAICGVVSDVGHLHTWLTTEKAQSELTKQILDKYQGSTKGIKPIAIRDLLRPNSEGAVMLCT